MTTPRLTLLLHVARAAVRRGGRGLIWLHSVRRGPHRRAVALWFTRTRAHLFTAETWEGDE